MLASECCRTGDSVRYWTIQHARTGSDMCASPKLEKKSVVGVCYRSPAYDDLGRQLRS